MGMAHSIDGNEIASTQKQKLVINKTNEKGLQLGNYTQTDRQDAVRQFVVALFATVFMIIIHEFNYEYMCFIYEMRKTWLCCHLRLSFMRNIQA